MPLDFPWPFYPLDKTPFHWKVRSRAMMAVVAGVSKVGLTYLNNCKVEGLHHLENVYYNRPRHQPLLTASNHTCCFDDPVFSGIFKLKWFLWNTENMRWGFGAHDICFTNKLYNKFFSLGKIVPIVRGDGVYQQGMELALEHLNRGGWFHIFPEGRVNMDPKTPMRFKWGIGRLIADCKSNPAILPFWHIGMDDILPNYVYFPKFQKNVTIVFGEPIDLGDVVQKLKAKNIADEQVWKHLTDTIQDVMHRLKVTAELKHIENFGEQS